MNRVKHLIIAPHPDDEVLGCGIFITDNGPRTHVHYMSISNSLFPEHKAMMGIDYMRDNYGIQTSVFPQGADKRGSLDTIPTREIVANIEGVIEHTEASEVFIPCPSHHHDHEVVRQACIAALRPGKRCNVTAIYMYEYVYNGWVGITNGLGRTYYRCSNSQVNEKTEMFKSYGGTERKLPNLLNSDAIINQAKSRGLECGHEAAEMYYLLYQRW